MVRMLVVEDDPNIRLLLTSLFRKRGYEVEEAQDGFEALQTLRNDSNFELLVTDMQMPTINGKKLIETVKTYYKHIYVVAISAHDASLTEAYGTGADSSIHKPFSYHSLVDIIEDIIRRKLPQKAVR